MKASNGRNECTALRGHGNTTFAESHFQIALLSHDWGFALLSRLENKALTDLVA
jgi:hypothetical protein